MKLACAHDPSIGRLTISVAENCHGDSTPPVSMVRFDRFGEALFPETAALAGALAVSRWCGEVLEFEGARLGSDFGEAVRLLAPDAKFIQPIDGYRRNLCDGNLDMLVAPASGAVPVLASRREAGGLTRLLTWSGEFVDRASHNSAGYVAGEVATNCDLLVPEWEVSVCLGLLAGGSKLRSIVVPEPPRKDVGRFERTQAALRIVGVRLRSADSTRETPPVVTVAQRKDRRGKLPSLVEIVA